jgi:Zn finger protein HypA/HybF involved in hydrogenase expression
MVDYITARKPVIIICPEHGEFRQIPYNHLIGKGCDKCARDLNRSKLTKTKDKFIDDAREVHGDKYNYDNSVYINDSSKIKIECPQHGEFIQKVNHHLRGQGCPKCRWINFGNTNKSKHSNLFPERASKIHNGFYDYSKVNYVDSKTKVEIICPNHGSFYQVPANHLSGKGCPLCLQSQGEKKISLIF